MFSNGPMRLTAFRNRRYCFTRFHVMIVNKVRIVMMRTGSFCVGMLKSVIPNADTGARASVPESGVVGWPGICFFLPATSPCKFFAKGGGAPLGPPHP